jgi:ankyrin repeat protein
LSFPVLKFLSLTASPAPQNGKTPLHIASSRGAAIPEEWTTHDVVKMLLEAGARE